MITLENFIITSQTEYSKLLVIVEIDNSETIQEALESNFTIRPCNHDYDCCGCVYKTRITKITNLDDNVYSALITYEFNV